MNVIAAVDKGWGIGCENRLLARIPDDMRRFRALTMGNVVVMGRKTREGIPGGMLQGRTNIVLSGKKTYEADGLVVVHSMEELTETLKRYDSDTVYVIGGGRVYCQLLDKCNIAYITKLDAAYHADAFFPNLDERPEWELTAQSGEHVFEGIRFYYCEYRKKTGGNHGYNRKEIICKGAAGRRR